MCKSTRQPNPYPNSLEIKSFIVRLSDLIAPNPIHEFLTLHFLPPIQENPLEIDGLKIRPGSPAIVSLHRFVASQPHQLIYGSRQRVRASQVMRFQVHLSEAMLLKGVLMKDHSHRCKLECELQVDAGHGVDRTSTPQVSEAEVCVAVEGDITITKRVTTAAMNLKRKRDRKPSKFKEGELEDIPEERELSYSDCNDIVADSGTRSTCSWDDSTTEGQSNSYYRKQYEVGLDVEGVRWAVDIGVWVICLGLGYLVSKASTKSIAFARRPRLL